MMGRMANTRTTMLVFIASAVRKISIGMLKIVAKSSHRTAKNNGPFAMSNDIEIQELIIRGVNTSRSCLRTAGWKQGVS